ncbi:SANT and BTB domain regulator of class switch recombination isoform X2 [Apis cerana]|uniref:SANT and BTB domain regulator of class switch recombination isoform X2 n=1 Tax=Apis cerana TaxID=7461 RepID=UPI002B23CF4C|nr:SANT and BTB domain regulator of class switch recombination isoform X2 [Apis cerana]
MEINQINNLLLKENIHKLLEMCASTTNKGICASDLTEIFCKLEDCNQSKLTIGMFFEFMKLAYQVNNNCESLTTILTSINKIDWSKLAKIDLDCTIQNYNSTDEKYINSDVMQKHKSTNATKEISSETNNTNIKYSVHCIVPSDAKFKNEPIDIYNQNLITDFEKCNQVGETSLQVEDAKIIKSVDTTKNLLITLMKTNLSDVLHEGLLDSVLPYMIPKPTISQPIIKKSITNTEVKKSNSLSNNIETRAITNIAHKEKDKKLSKRSIDNEVEIHVCDEEKNIKKNFRCPQKLLIQKMRYFADVTAGQKLEEIDISVHCDVTIFDWLMRWVKKDIIKKSEWPVLEINNVIPIMVSASFLQMEPLLESCLQYCHDNMSDILKTSTVLTGLDDNLLIRLVEQFTNEDVEALKDKKDKIQSKLFCKLIMSLVEVMPDNKKGHYSSLATLFKCSKCEKNIIQSVSNYVPCISSAMKIDNYGNIHSKHIRDLTWTLNDYIIALRTELRSWRKVYWRLWGDCHFLFCTQCNIYFPIHQYEWCCYHAEFPQFFINEQQRPIPFPLGRYPCCSQRAYKFEVLPNHEGCRYREHIPDIRTQRDISILNIFTVHREVIVMEPPQLFFPEKITRLVARDVSLQPGKLMCKDVMWWVGLELAPPRPRLGLLGKIWSGSGFRRLSQMQDLQKSLQKIRQQVSITTDTSSITSSITDSDIDDGITTYENTSIDEESNQSEESHAWSSLKSKNKIKKKFRNEIMWRNNGRSWSGNLNVRHNQDNQRDFEESAALQMIALLTKRISADSSSLFKSSNKHNRIKKQLNGGIYTKLETELRDQLNQSYKNKNITGKYFLRSKLNKS